MAVCYVCTMYTHFSMCVWCVLHYNYVRCSWLKRKTHTRSYERKKSPKNTRIYMYRYRYKRRSTSVITIFHLEKTHDPIWNSKQKKAFATRSMLLFRYYNQIYNVWSFYRSPCLCASLGLCVCVRTIFFASFRLYTNLFVFVFIYGFTFNIHQVVVHYI